MTKRHLSAVAANVLREIKREAGRDRRSRRWLSDCEHHETELDARMDDPDIAIHPDRHGVGVLYPFQLEMALWLAGMAGRHPGVPSLASHQRRVGGYQ